MQLFKTGRTNANDGGIDFVMRPVGRFFQVTEVNNYDKYLLDIDKVMHFPVSFVIKTTNSKKKGIPIRSSADFSTETLQARRGWHDILKSDERRTYNQEYSTQQDSPSDLMEKSKAFKVSKS